MTRDPCGILRLRARNRQARPRITVELAVSGPVNDRMALTQTRAITRPAVPCVAVPTTVGTGQLGAVHSLAGVVGGMAGVPHGIACAAPLALVIEANVRALRPGRPASLPLTATTERPGC